MTDTPADSAPGIDLPGIAPPLAEALRRQGYDSLTPVQEAVLAPELEGRDLLVSARTGSGKTVAFGLAAAPTLLGGEDRLGPAGAPMGLVIAPTRELALQVMRELEWLYAPAGARVASCVGGMDMRTERRALASGAHLVVGTPGRLRDHVERGSLDVTGLRVVVLDEADEMLHLGFRDDLEYLLGTMPEGRRTLLFSATVAGPIAALAKTYQRDAARVTAGAAREAHGDISYRALVCSPADRDAAVINTLRFFEAKTALVFCATRAEVSRMVARFANRGFAVVSLSGELSQSERTHALQALRDGRAKVCIATDVAARGIDLPDLELVVHADLPRSKEALVHRSGRTGRAGRKGTAVLVVTHTARRRTERLLEQAGIKAEWSAPPTAEEVALRDDERLLEDPALAEAPSADEAALVGQLLARHGAERVAAALVRLSRAGRSAPEDLDDDGSAAPERPREAFGPSVWVLLSVGRKQGAEPRWVLPLLCREGRITRREIGAIRVRETETWAEIAEPAAGRFFEALGPGAKLEGTVAVRRAEGPPPEDDRTARTPPRPGAGPRGPRPDGGPRKPRPEGAPRKPHRGKPGRGD